MPKFLSLRGKRQNGNVSLLGYRKNARIRRRIFQVKVIIRYPRQKCKNVTGLSGRFPEKQTLTPIFPYIAIISLSYLYGGGLRADQAEAVKYLQLAADQKDARAFYCLGLCFENGWGVEPDPGKAAESYRAGADLGLDCAQYKPDFDS